MGAFDDILDSSASTKKTAPAAGFRAFDDIVDKPATAPRAAGFRSFDDIVDEPQAPTTKHQSPSTKPPKPKTAHPLDVMEDIGVGVKSAFADVIPMDMARMARGGNIDLAKYRQGETFGQNTIDTNDREIAATMLSDEEAAQKIIPFLPFTRGGLREGLRNTGHSMAPIAGGFVAGAAAGAVFDGPAPVADLIGGVIGAGFATAPVMYRSQKDSFVQSVLDSALEANPAMTDEEWAEKRGAIENDAQLYAMWEAAPEVAGNMIGMGLMKLPVGQFIKNMPVFKNTVQSAIGRTILSKSLSAGAKMGVDLPLEIGTEAVTEYKQSRLLENQGLGEAVSAKQALANVWEQTFVMSMAMMGAGSTINSTLTTSQKWRTKNHLIKNGMPEEAAQALVDSAPGLRKEAAEQVARGQIVAGLKKQGVRHESVLEVIADAATISEANRLAGIAMAAEQSGIRDEEAIFALFETTSGEELEAVAKEFAKQAERNDRLERAAWNSENSYLARMDDATLQKVAGERGLTADTPDRTELLDSIYQHDREQPPETVAAQRRADQIALVTSTGSLEALKASATPEAAPAEVATVEPAYVPEEVPVAAPLDELAELDPVEPGASEIDPFIGDVKHQAEFKPMDPARKYQLFELRAIAKKRGIRSDGPLNTLKKRLLSDETMRAAEQEKQAAAEARFVEYLKNPQVVAAVQQEAARGIDRGELLLLAEAVAEVNGEAGFVGVSAVVEAGSYLQAGRTAAQSVAALYFDKKTNQQTVDRLQSVHQALTGMELAARSVAVAEKVPHEATKHEAPSTKPKPKHPVSSIKHQAPSTKDSAPSTETPTPKEKIEDFGEVIDGARKHYAAEMMQVLQKAKTLDVANYPLNKTWPAPKYDKLLEMGIDPIIVGWIRAARDEIPAKPRAGWKMARYVDAVTSFRSVSEKLIDGRITKERLMQMIEAPDSKRIFNAVFARAELYARVGHAKSLKGLKVVEGTYSVFDSKEYSPSKTIFSVEKGQKNSSAFDSMPWLLAYGDTRAEALDAFEKVYATMDTETTEKGVAMYSMAPRDTAPKGLPVDRVNMLVEGLGIEGAQVVATVDELPAHLRADVKRQRGKVEGVRDPVGDQIYLIAGNLTNIDTAQAVLLEEVWHRGLARFEPQQVNQLLDGAFKGLFLQKNKELRELAKLYNLPLNHKDPATRKQNRRIVAEELIAKLYRERTTRPAMWKRLLQTARLMVRKMGFSLKLSDADFEMLFAAAVKRGSRQEGAETVNHKGTKSTKADEVDDIRYSVLRSDEYRKDIISKMEKELEDQVNRIAFDVSDDTDDITSIIINSRDYRFNSFDESKFIIRKNKDEWNVSLDDISGNEVELMHDSFLEKTDAIKYGKAELSALYKEWFIDYIDKKDILTAMDLPSHIQIKDIHVAATGSIYYDIEISDVNNENFDNMRVSIRDHEPSPVREKQFGHVSFYADVSDLRDWSDISKAVKRVEEYLNGVEPLVVVSDEYYAQDTESKLLPEVDPSSIKLDKARKEGNDKNIKIPALRKDGEKTTISPDEYEKLSGNRYVYPKHLYHNAPYAIFTALKEKPQGHGQRLMGSDFVWKLNEGVVYSNIDGYGLKKGWSYPKGENYLFAKWGDFYTESAWKEKEKANKGQVRTAYSLNEKQPSLEGGIKGNISAKDVNTRFSQAPTSNLQVSSLGFYSAVEKTITELKQETFTVDQLLGQLHKAPGVKQEELDDLGLVEWLDAKKEATEVASLDSSVKTDIMSFQSTRANPRHVPVSEQQKQNETDRKKAQVKITKNEVLEFVRAGGVQLEEVEKGSGTKFKGYQLPGGENYREVLLTLPERPRKYNNADSMAFDRKVFATMDFDELVYNYKDRFNRSPIGLSEDQMIEEMVTQYTARNLTGDVVDKENTYTSSHWDEKNVLAHVRLNDRTGPDGEKILFIEEIQSDWHQAGRKKGYFESPEYKAQLLEVNSLNTKIAERNAVVQEKIKILRPAFEKQVDEYKFAGKKATPEMRRVALGVFDAIVSGEFVEFNVDIYGTNRRLVVEHSKLFGDHGFFPSDLIPFVALKEAEAIEALLPLPSANRNFVPNAPHKKSWAMLAFKRVLKMAADGGYDAVAWTPGDVQNNRYDLSKQVDSISWRENWQEDINLTTGKQIPAGTFNIGFKKDGHHHTGINGNNGLNGVTREELPNVVGKEIALRIFQAAEEESYGELSGVDLEIGGSGMKGFYDKILPKEVQKYVKKMGGKVGTVDVLNGSEFLAATARDYEGTMTGDFAKEQAFTKVWNLPITEAMRSTVAQGQPRYSIAPPTDSPEPEDFWDNLVVESKKPPTDEEYENQLEQLRFMSRADKNVHRKKRVAEAMELLKKAPRDQRWRAIPALKQMMDAWMVPTVDKRFRYFKEKVALAEVTGERLAVMKLIQKEYQGLKRSQGKGRRSQTAEANDALMGYLLELREVSEQPKAEANALLDKQIAWVQDHPGEEMSQAMKRAIEQLFANNIYTMDMPGLADVRANIKSIKLTGQTEFRAAEQAREKALNNAALEAVLELNSKKDGKTTLQRAVDNSKQRSSMTSTVKLAKQYGWAHIRPERIAEWFARFKKGSTFKQMTFERGLTAEETKLENVQKTMETFAAIHENIDHHTLKKEYLSLDTEWGRVGITYDMGMFVYANSQNDGNAAHLAGTGIVNEIRDEIIDQLPQNYKDAVDAMIDFYDSDAQYERLNEVFRREHHISMPKEARYFPIRNLDSALAENALMADLLARHSSRAGTQKGFTKRRIQSKAAFRKLSYIDTLVNNLLETEHYIAYNDAAREIGQFLNQATLRSAMDSRSEEANRQMREWLKAIAYGKISASNHPIDKISEFLRTNYVTSVLGFNIVTMLKQPASFAQGARRIDPRETVASAQKFIAHPKEQIAFVNQRSVMMRNRANSFERELAEMREKGQMGRLLKTESALKKFRETSMQPIQAADKATTTILWYGKFMEQVNKGAKEADAAGAADELIRKTQPMGGLVHLAEVYRAGGIARAYTMFTNQLNQNLNLTFEMGSDQSKGVRDLALDALMFWVIPSMLIYAASNGGEPPWKEPKKWAKAFVSNITGGLVLFNNFFNSLMAGLTGEADGVQYITNLLPAPLSPVEDFYKAVAQRRPGKLLEASTKLTGIPFAQPRRTVAGFKEAVDKKDVRRVIWSKYALDKRPGELRSDFIKNRMSSLPKKTASIGMVKRRMESDFKLAVAQGATSYKTKAAFNQAYKKQLEKQYGKLFVHRLKNSN